MKRPKSRRGVLIDTLLAAYDAGVISLSGFCPHCDKDQGSFSHGVCQHCKKGCGCSFNPTSRGDHCNLHGQMGEYQRNKP